MLVLCHPGHKGTCVICIDTILTVYFAVAAQGGIPWPFERDAMPQRMQLPAQKKEWLAITVVRWGCEK